MLYYSIRIFCRTSTKIAYLGNFSACFSCFYVLFSYFCRSLKI
nr:MAG TPA: hypothetical protein [Caudoviricetes sp.]